MFLKIKEDPFIVEDFKIQKTKYVDPKVADLFLVFEDEEDKDLWVYFSHQVNRVLKSEIDEEFKKNILSKLIEKYEDLLEYISPVMKDGKDVDKNTIFVTTKFNVLESESSDLNHW